MAGYARLVTRMILQGEVYSDMMDDMDGMNMDNTTSMAMVRYTDEIQLSSRSFTRRLVTCTLYL